MATTETAAREVVYPPNTVWDSEGYPQYWDSTYKCWMHPVVWDTRTGKVIYALQPKQWELLKLTPLMRPHGEPGPTRIGFGGSAGSSKSHCARAIATVAAHQWPGSTSIIFRKTEKEVKENHLTKFNAEVPREIFEVSNLDITWPSNGSRTLLGHLRHEDDVYKYQGNDYDLMIFEEATHYSWSQVSWLIGNRLRASVDGTTPFALFPTNPGGQGHFWFKRIFIDRRYNEEQDERPEDHAFLPAKLADNYVLRHRDPNYEKKLNTLAEPYRSWLRDGDFEAGAGMALPSLRRKKHLVQVFEPPRHWTLFGAFDWGFAHPFSFGWYVANEDGRVFKGDTITGRHLSDREIADRIVQSLRSRGIDPARLSYIVAGHDAWDEVKARASGIPTTAETFVDFGLHMIKANTSRIAGLKQLRKMLDWEKVTYGPQGTLIDDDPFLRFMDTPGNRTCYEVLESRVPDPDNIEDVLKTNADDFGQGGDDPYDETRYACASRPAPARSLIKDQSVNAWSQATLQHEYEQGRRVRSEPVKQGGGVVHPEFGEIA